MSGRAELMLPPDVHVVSTARGWASDTLRSWSCADLLDPVRLVVTELVGNAVQHARTDLRLTLRLDAHTLRCAVSDALPGRIGRVSASPTAASGRGLDLVARSSDRWGVDYSPGGKTVWAEWSRAPARPRPDPAVRVSDPAAAGSPDRQTNAERKERPVGDKKSKKSKQSKPSKQSIATARSQKAAGKAKELVGVATGNRTTEVKGKLQQATARVKEAGARMRRRSR